MGASGSTASDSVSRTASANGTAAVPKATDSVRISSPYAASSPAVCEGDSAGVTLSTAPLKVTANSSQGMATYPKEGSAR